MENGQKAKSSKLNASIMRMKAKARTAKAKARSPERYASARRTKAQRAPSGKMKAREPGARRFEREDKG